MEVNTTMKNRELNRAICKAFIEIAEGEKKKAIALGDYPTALVCAILERMLRNAIMHF